MSLLLAELHQDTVHIRPAGPGGHTHDELAGEQLLRIWSTVARECREGIVVCDALGQIVFVNNAFEHCSGYGAAEILGQTLNMLHATQGEDFYGTLWTAVRSTGHWHGEICTRHKGGALRTQALSLAAVPDRRGIITHFIAVFADTLQRERAQDRIRHLTGVDLLTQLPNRRFLIDKLDSLLVAAAKSDAGLALLLIDLDRFKNVNDSLGHQAGDELLKCVGQRLRPLLRRSDLIARMGGDEFAVVLTGVFERQDVQRMAERMLAAIAQPLPLADLEVVISASAGICMFPEDAHGTSELLRNADTAMHAAKQAGSGTCEFYAPAMGRNARDSFDIETGLRRALEQAELELYFQPQMDLRSGRICSAEALLRWNRPGVGMVAPGSFITLAEERGLIGAIDTWSLQAATRQLSAWDRAGLVLPRIAVNISASHFHRGDLLQSVTGALQSAGLTAQRLELEVTESVLLQDSAATLQLMRELRRLGVALAIDDFGTGYSSLSYLRRLPLHELKIDRSFVVAMLEDPAVQGIVHGIITLAHGLGLRVIAEGVESEAQLEQLRVLGCDFAQGFVLGRPMPAHAFAELLSRAS